MLKIIVDIADVADFDELRRKVEDQIGEAIDETLEYAQQQWASNINNRALRELVMSKQAIQKDSPTSGSVVIDDSQAEEMLNYEIYGHGAWDMKPGLLASPKAKASKKTGNRYITIPFHGNIRGRNPFTSRRAESSEDLEEYDDMIYEASEEGTYRRVSDKSPATSWIYPAREPNPAADPNTVSDDVEDHLLELLEEIFE